MPSSQSSTGCPRISRRTPGIVAELLDIPEAEAARLLD
jgi:hypothetical protein